MSGIINGVKPKTKRIFSADGQECTQWIWRMDNDRCLTAWAVGSPPLPGDAKQAVDEIRDWLKENPERTLVAWEEPEGEGEGVDSEENVQVQ